jgi:hypothetical protein
MLDVALGTGWRGSSSSGGPEPFRSAGFSKLDDNLTDVRRADGTEFGFNYSTSFPRAANGIQEAERFDPVQLH